jgi:hypothetical protein
LSFKLGVVGEKIDSKKPEKTGEKEKGKILLRPDWGGWDAGF